MCARLPRDKRRVRDLVESALAQHIPPVRPIPPEFSPAVRAVLRERQALIRQRRAEVRADKERLRRKLLAYFAARAADGATEEAEPPVNLADARERIRRDRSGIVGMAGPPPDPKTSTAAADFSGPPEPTEAGELGSDGESGPVPNIAPPRDFAPEIFREGKPAPRCRR